MQKYVFDDHSENEMIQGHSENCPRNNHHYIWFLFKIKNND